MKVFINGLFKVVILLVVILLSNFVIAQESVLIDSLKLRSEQVQDTLLIETLDELSWEYKYVTMDSAFHYANKALDLAKKIEYPKAIANSYNTLGSNYEYVSKLDSALYFYTKSLEIKRIINDTVGVANSLNNVGIVHDEKGNHEKALKNYFDSLQIYESQEVSFDKVPMVLVNIGVVYKKMGNYAKVLDYYQRALDIYEANDHDVGIVITKGNIGNTLLRLEKYEESISFSTEARTMYSDLGYSRYVPYMNVQIANALDSLKQFKEARKLYTQAASSFTADNNEHELADAKIGLANNYLQSNLFRQALIISLEALDIARKNDFKDYEVKALNLIHCSYSKLGQNAKAYTYAMKYDRLKEALFEKEKVKSVYELEIKYETEKRENELLIAKAAKAETEKDLLLTQNEKLETENTLSKTKNWIYFLIFIVLTVALTFFLILQTRKRRNQEEKLRMKESAFSAVIEAQETERNKIARELHDGVVQELGSIILKSRQYFKTNPDLNVSTTQELVNSLEKSAQDVRTISHQMMPRALVESGLVEAMEELLESSLKPAGITYSYDHFNLSERLPKNIETTIYRIAQELINNILKHSKAENVHFQLFKQAERLVLIVEDDGIGFQKSSESKGIGTHNIESRLDLVNGSYHRESGPHSKGTVITVRVPLKKS
ncbi:MAG: sensor histidine kinase [Nonlabens sp.]